MRRAVNLASDPFINYRPFWVTVTALGLLALVLTAALGVEGFTVWRRGTQAQERLFDLQQRRNQLETEQTQLEAELRVPQTMAVLERAGFLNHLISQKRLSWARLFVDLEKALPARTRVVSLAPRLRDDGRVEVRLRVGADSEGALVELLESLGQSGKFPEYRIDSVSSEGSRGDAVVAQLIAIYAQGNKQ
jgi:Tfp pilus assembly protein PilN